MKRAPAQRCDIAIVGLGPVGVTLASLLGAMGHSVIGVDASFDIFDKPRAIGLDHESLRTFQTIGMSDRLAPFIETYRNSEYRAANGALLMRIVAAPEPFPLAWPPNVTFVQPGLEGALRENAKRFTSVDLRFGAEVTDIRDIDSRPALIVRDLAGDVSQEISCRFAVACDGATSFVRKSLAIESEDLAFDEPWLVVDVLLTEDVGLPELNIQFCDPDRPTTYVRGPGGLRRWEFMLLPGETPAALQKPERIWQLLRPWLRPDQARIWRAATYRFHALVAETWRKGCVFLAGDAAHQTPPFLAQGLNQGVRDASNLAWKLSAALQGAPDALLDTYEVERRPNVREVIATTKKLGQIVCERDPRAVHQRNQAMQAEVAAGTGTRIRQSMLPPIRHGLIACDEEGRLVRGAGEMCPQPWIDRDGGRSRLDDIVGGGFYVLVTEGMVIDEEIATLSASIHATIVRFTSSAHVATGPIGELTVTAADKLLDNWMAERNAKAAVVRPDHIVFGTAADETGLSALLRRLASSMGAI